MSKQQKDYTVENIIGRAFGIYLNVKCWISILCQKFTTAKTHYICKTIFIVSQPDKIHDLFDSQMMHREENGHDFLASQTSMFQLRIWHELQLALIVVKNLSKIAILTKMCQV